MKEHDSSPAPAHNVAEPSTNVESNSNNSLTIITEYLDAQSENMRCLNTIQNWKTNENKWRVLTKDLKRGESRLPYEPACIVLTVLMKMAQVKTTDYGLEFKNSKQFTREGRLQTNLVEIQRLALRYEQRKLSFRVIKYALALLHEAGYIYKTHGGADVGRYGGLLYIDLKGYRLKETLKNRVQYLRSLPETIGIRESVGNVKDTSSLFESKRHDRAPHIYSLYNKVNSQPGESVCENPQNQVSEVDRLKVVDVMKFVPPPPLQGGNAEKGIPPGIPASLPLKTEEKAVVSCTPQVQAIIKFLQAHACFVDDHNVNQPLKAPTSPQEALLLAKAVEVGGLSLGFLKRYVEAIRCQWFDSSCLKCTLEYFCRHFYIIKKQFNVLYSQNANQLNGYDFKRACQFKEIAEQFIRSFFFSSHPTSKTPRELAVLCLMCSPLVDPRSDYAICAQKIFLGFTLPQLLEEDRQKIYDSNRLWAQKYFNHCPGLLLGLRELGFDLQGALQIKDMQTVVDEFTRQYVSAKASVDFHNEVINENVETLMELGASVPSIDGIDYESED
jgi:hypothetical protein